MRPFQMPQPTFRDPPTTLEGGSDPRLRLRTFVQGAQTDSFQVGVQAPQSQECWVCLFPYSNFLGVIVVILLHP